MDHRRRDLLYLAYDMRRRKATDRRDKLFALLGVAKDGPGFLEGFVPDYTSPVEETYQRFLEHLRKIYPGDLGRADGSIE